MRIIIVIIIFYKKGKFGRRREGRTAAFCKRTIGRKMRIQLASSSSSSPDDDEDDVGETRASVRCTVRSLNSC